MEKVIQGVKDVKTIIPNLTNETDANWIIRRLDKAIAMLKTYEAQIMTPEEVSAVKQNDVIWYESRISKLCEPLIRRGNDFKNDLHFLLLDEVTDCDDYLKNYRCWTEKPTEKQRNETSWG